MLFKIIHRFVELPLPDYIVPAPCATKGNSVKFIQLATSVNSYKFSFFSNSIRNWNKLPEDMVNVTSLSNFRTLLK